MKKQLKFLIITGTSIFVILLFIFYSNNLMIQKDQLTRRFLVVDDFEDYNDIKSFRIWDKWIDGWDDEANGSFVGYPEAEFDLGEHIIETKIVHSGSQSAPIIYDLEFGIFSEVTISTANLEIGKNWKADSPDTLTLWFYGNPDNDLAKMYIMLNNSKIYYKNPRHLTKKKWRQWNISLSEFGIDLINVYMLSIGFEKSNKNSDGTGLVFIDDIRLYRNAPEHR
jgi:hypothetical protein